jgi:hypothetical protein
MSLFASQYGQRVDTILVYIVTEELQQDKLGALSQAVEEPLPRLVELCRRPTKEEVWVAFIKIEDIWHLYQSVRSPLSRAGCTYPTLSSFCFMSSPSSLNVSCPATAMYTFFSSPILGWSNGDVYL